MDFGLAPGKGRKMAESNPEMGTACQNLDKVGDKRRIVEISHMEVRGYGFRNGHEDQRVL